MPDRRLAGVGFRIPCGVRFDYRRSRGPWRSSFGSEAWPRRCLQRLDARDAARGDGLDDRRNRAADDRGRSRGARAAVVGDERVSACTDRGHASLREARRPAGPQADPAERDRPVPHGFGTVRDRRVDDAADRLPSGPGAGCRRLDRARAGNGRGHRLSARARALSGIVRRGLRGRECRRPIARRGDRRARVVALDLLCEPSDRPGRPGRDHDDAAGGRHAQPARDRLPGRGCACQRIERDRARCQPRGHDLGMGLGADRARRRGGRGAVRCLPGSRAPRA